MKTKTSKTLMVYLKNGQIHPIIPQNSYDRFLLEYQQGVPVWVMNNHIFPHENVLCIVEEQQPETKADAPEVKPSTDEVPF